jgi:MbtH protein
MTKWSIVTSEERTHMSHATVDNESESVIYRVVRNDEEQYSIWAVDRDLPPGWQAEGTVGPRQVCLDQINRIWTDIRPLSLRRRTDQTT